MATSSDIRSVYIYMDTYYFYLSKKIKIIYFTEQAKVYLPVLWSTAKCVPTKELTLPAAVF